MAKIETVKIPANNAVGYVVINAEDAETEAAAKWKVGLPIDETETSEEADADLDEGGEDDPKTGDEANTEYSKNQLRSMRKAELIVIAENLGHSIVPDEVTVDQLIETILAE